LAGNDRDQSVLRQLFSASTVGIHLVLCTFAGFGIGYALDEFFGVWYLKFVFLVIGIVAGFVELFRVVKKQEEKNDSGKSAGDGPKDN
jgi:ATP synthase protein I